VVLLAAASALSACRKPVYFPVESAGQAAKASGATAAYDPNGDGRAEFFTFISPDGRIDRIGYDTTGDETPDQIIPLDTIPFARCRHLVLVLDGFAYDLVSRHYQDGGLRMFYPPSRVVAPYPTMTDTSIQDITGGMPCRSYEARYFDRKTGRLAGGSHDYLAGKNEPYNRVLHYRAWTLWDVLGYVDPWAVFGKEVNDAKRLFDRGESKEVLAYFVSSAGVSTRMGAEGQKRSLLRMEQFVQQVIWETRGLTKVTLISDHGHTYTPSRRIDLEGYLRTKGWRPCRKLRGPKDVICVQFGLVTCANFATQQPAALAEDLTACQGVELASFAEKDTVVLLGRGGQRAVIRQNANRYKYEPVSGDPLKLKDALLGLKADADGYYGADDLLAATLMQEYPAALERLWRAHFGLVQNTPDVIASLQNEFFAGSGHLAQSVTVASTHGGLNYANSVTFIMSTAGPLPAYMRSSDIPAGMRALTGADWPARK
jgi:hypothetical protein